MRSTYSGQGGPLGRAVVSTRSFDDRALSTRFDRLMLDLDRMNLMRIAVEKVPYAMPLHSSYRFTSPFGRRWGRMHAGIDLAAPRGTPIFATAGGVVTAAGRGERLRQRGAHPARVRLRDRLCPPEQNPGEGRDNRYRVACK